MNIFIKNQNKPERILRLLLSIPLIPSLFIMGVTPYSIILFSIGLILLFNSVVGTCMIYKFLGINTCKINN